MITIASCATLWLTLWWLGMESQAQPTGCTEDAHCPADYFCESSFCRECLQCKSFLREDPLVPTKCVQSVTECGNCLEGLADERSGDPSASCVSGGAGAGGGAGGNDGVPLYVWIIVGVTVPLVPVVALVIFTYATSKLTLFKISGITSTHTFQGGGAVGPAGEPQSSAPPMPPPPYNTHFTDTPLYVQEEESPLVKVCGIEEEGGVEGMCAARARLTERGVGARVFNNPAYVRAAPAPHSLSVALDEEGGVSPEPPALHDESTMESAWTPMSSPPAPPTHHTPAHASEQGEGDNTVASVGETSAVSGGDRGAMRRPAPGDCGPLAKHLCLTQGEGSRSSGGRGEEAPPAGPSVMLNFNLNVNANAVQQLNNVTLFE